jgi:hypothetical protein
MMSAAVAVANWYLQQEICRFPETLQHTHCSSIKGMVASAAAVMLEALQVQAALMLEALQAVLQHR